MARAAVRRVPYVLYARHGRPQMWRALARELAIQRPDILYCDHLDSFQYSRLAGVIPFVVDCHNVYSVLVRRQAHERGRGPGRSYLLREARLLEVVERRVAQTASAVLAVSAEDLGIFRLFGAKTPRLVPNGVDCAHYANIPVAQRSGDPLILYVGTMSWAPNASAAVFLARAILPRVQATHPDARLRIIGREPPQAVAELATLPGVEVTGAVPDVRPHLRAAHALAVPLETGGGSRLKILEAFAAGLPVVSTPVGCEGLEVVDGKHTVIAEREAFAEAISCLLQSPATALHLAGEARELVKARYDWQSIGSVACAALRSVLEGPQ